MRCRCAIHHAGRVIVFFSNLCSGLNQLVDKEFFAQINELAMHDPRVHLMIKYFMALKSNAGEHRFHYWVAGSAAGMEH